MRSVSPPKPAAFPIGRQGIQALIQSSYRDAEIRFGRSSIHINSDFDVEKLTSLVAMAYVVDKENVIIIMGNPDVPKHPSDLMGELKCTDSHTNFSIYVNK